MIYAYQILSDFTQNFEAISLVASLNLISLFVCTFKLFLVTCFRLQTSRVQCVFRSVCVCFISPRGDYRPFVHTNKIMFKITCYETQVCFHYSTGLFSWNLRGRDTGAETLLSAFTGCLNLPSFSSACSVTRVVRYSWSRSTKRKLKITG
jgi:hypothetical protein